MTEPHENGTDDRPTGWADDPRAFLAAAYDLHADRLYRYALMLLADPEAAEDAVQQVFLGLARTKRRSADISSCGRYLRTAVRHECWRAGKRRRRGPTIIEAASDSPLLEAAGHEPVDPDERARLEAALRSLPPEQREVIHLKVYEGWTFQQIADFLGLSINSVASRYRYAIDKLRRHLNPQGAGEGGSHEPQ